jgi:hypothetical protein
LTLLDSVISSIIPNGGIVIDTTEAGGDIVINDSAFDVDGNLTVANNLTVTGSFNNPFTPKAWCIFTDISNIIVIESQSNVSSIVNNSDGIYEIFFTTPMSDINYGVLISLGSTGGSFPFVSHGFWTTRNTSSVVISIVDASGELVSSVPYGATIMIMST